jgi:hypothetical protein
MSRDEMLAECPSDGLIVRHMVVCEDAQRDDSRTHQFTLQGLVNVLPFPKDETLVLIHRWYAYCQVFGTESTYAVEVRLRRIEFDEFGGIVSVDGEEQVFGPYPIEFVSEDFVTEFALPMRNVQFRQPGYYDFELWYHHGSEEALATERIWVKPS